MKLKTCFVIRQLAGEHIMIAAGSDTFSGMVRSNATAAFIINCLKEDTTKEEIVAKMMEKYDAPQDLNEKSVEDILNQLRSIDAIEA